MASISSFLTHPLFDSIFTIDTEHHCLLPHLNLQQPSTFLLQLKSFYLYLSLLFVLISRFPTLSFPSFSVQYTSNELQQLLLFLYYQYLFYHYFPSSANDAPLLFPDSSQFITLLRMLYYITKQRDHPKFSPFFFLQNWDSLLSLLLDTYRQSNIPLPELDQILQQTPKDLSSFTPLLQQRCLVCDHLVCSLFLYGSLLVPNP